MKILSWHNSYAMKLCLSYTQKICNGGLVQYRKCCVLDYMKVGKNHVDGGSEGGAFMDPQGNGENEP